VGDSQVSVPDSATLEPGQVTVLAWVKHNGNPGNYKYILGKGAQGCTASSYALTSSGTGGLSFYAFNGSAASVSPDPGAGIWNGQWHAVAGTFDGITVRLYVDGNEVGGGTPGAFSLAYDLTTDDLRIGNYPLSNQCGSGFVWPGLIDEVRVYNRALAANEIAHLHNPAHTTPPNLPAPGPPPPPPPPPGPQGGLEPRLAINPNPSCPYTFTRLDASASGGGSAGIASYRFEYVEPRYTEPKDPTELSNFPVRQIGTRTIVIADGPDPMAVTAFSGGKIVDFQLAKGIILPTLVPVFQLEPKDIKLTVTDRNGVSASITRRLDFVVTRADANRSRCPAGESPPSYFPPLRNVANSVKVVGGALVQATVPCASPLVCSGALSLARASSGAASAGARRRATLLARTSFTIPAGGRERVRAKLSRRARRLLAERGRVRAVMVLSTLRQNGNVMTKTRRVTLRRSSTRRRGSGGR
jgi:hypothetical protein